MSTTIPAPVRVSLLPKRARPPVLSRADYERFSPMIRRIARKLSRRLPPTILLSDLTSCGWVGILESLGRVGHLPAGELDAYAARRVRGAMLDHLRTLDSATGKSRQAGRRLAQAERALQHRLGRAPDESELARALMLSLAQLSELRRRAHAATESTLGDVDSADLPSASPLPDDLVASARDGARLRAAVARLPERQRRILALYYSESQTLREIGVAMGVTESRVSQLHTTAVRQLRAALRLAA